MTLREELLSKAWTAEELSTLRESYATKGPQYVAERTGRSWMAVCVKASALGLAKHRHWNDIESRSVRNWWGVESIASIAARLHRPRRSVFHHAVVTLGLPRGVQPGQELLAHAAKRTGYETATLRRILSWHGVKLTRPMVDPTRRKNVRVAVESDDVDDAVAAYLDSETLSSAAKRRGVWYGTLERALNGVPGVPKKPAGKRHWRIPSELIDRALGLHGKVMKGERR